MVRIRADALAAVAADAAERFPDEACGILLGRGDEVALARPAANAAAPAQRGARFVIDPRDTLAAHAAGAARGLEVVGFYHSHPRAEARPSARDRAEVGAGLHLLVAVDAGQPGDVRAWRVAAGAWVEEDMVQEPGSPWIADA